MLQFSENRVRRDLDAHGTTFTLELGKRRIDDGRFGAPWTVEGDHLMLLLFLAGSGGSAAPNLHGLP